MDLNSVDLQSFKYLLLFIMDNYANFLNLNLPRPCLIT